MCGFTLYPRPAGQSEALRQRLMSPGAVVQAKTYSSVLFVIDPQIVLAKGGNGLLEQSSPA